MRRIRKIQTIIKNIPLNIWRLGAVVRTKPTYITEVPIISNIAAGKSMRGLKLRFPRMRSASSVNICTNLKYVHTLDLLKMNKNVARIYFVLLSV